MGATQIMNNLRQNAEYRLGHNPQVDPMYFNDEINHLCEMPGDAESPLSRLGRFAPGVITDFDVQMNRHAERLTPQQWEQLRGIHTQLAQTAQGAQDFLLPYWVESSVSDLLAAWRPIAASRFQPADLGCHGRRPHAQVISAEHFGADLIKSVSQMYVGLLQAAAPDMPQPVMDAALMNSSSFGLSSKKLIALTRPHAHISLKDISVATGMGALSGIDEETAYGLVTDFRRRGKNTVMQFEDRNGNGFATSPFSISDEENTSENPHFTEIIGRKAVTTRRAACPGHAVFLASAADHAPRPQYMLPRRGVQRARQFLRFRQGTAGRLRPRGHHVRSGVAAHPRHADPHWYGWFPYL